MFLTACRAAGRSLIRRFVILSFILTLVTVVTASAALLEVDGSVIQVFEPEVNIPNLDGNADIQITPQSLNADANGDPLQAHISLPEGSCSQMDIVFESITLRVEGVSASVSPVSETARNQNKLIVRFSRQAVIGLIGDHEGEDVTLEVRGADVNGCHFSGTDTITYMASRETDSTTTLEPEEPVTEPGHGDESDGDDPTGEPGDSGADGTRDDTTTTTLGATGGLDAGSQQAADPTPTPVPATPTTAPTEVAPTATPTPEPTAIVTAEPIAQGNVLSAGAPPGATPGISWFFHSCAAENAGLAGWELAPSARPGVFVVELTDAPVGLILTCDVYVANSGTAPVAIAGIVADFDPAAFAVEGELGQRGALEPCAAAPEWGSQPYSVSERCWQVVTLTIEVGAPVAQDWLAFSVVAGPAN